MIRPESAALLGFHASDEVMVRSITHAPMAFVAVLAGLSLVADDSHANGRPFRFTACHALQVEVRSVPDVMEASKQDMDSAAEKRIARAGLLAERPNDGFFLRFRVIEHPDIPFLYLVDGDVFHRMDDHEYGNGHVILWGMFGMEGYSNASVAVQGVISFVEEMTDAFIADYQRDNARCVSTNSWWR